MVSSASSDPVCVFSCSGCHCCAHFWVCCCVFVSDSALDSESPSPLLTRSAPEAHHRLPQQVNSREKGQGRSHRALTELGPATQIIPLPLLWDLGLLPFQSSSSANGAIPVPAS